MAPAVPVHWPVYIGTRWTRTLTWYTSKTEYEADKTTATKMNLTGYTGQAIMRRKEGDSTAVLTFATTDDSMTLGGANGTIVLLLGGDVTTGSKDPGKYVCDIILTDASSNVLEPTLSIIFEFIPTVTVQ